MANGLNMFTPFENPRQAPKPPPPRVRVPSSFFNSSRHSTPSTSRRHSLDFNRLSWLHPGFGRGSRAPDDYDLESMAGSEFDRSNPATRPGSIYRGSARRYSLTPSEVSYPMALFHAEDERGYGKVERVLGLRRQSRPPPVPPKPSRQFEEGTKPVVIVKETMQPWPDAVIENIERPGVSANKVAEAPRNGRMAWLHALTGMFVVFSCWGLGNAFGLFQAYYETRFPDTSPSTISWIGSTQLALVFGLGVPVGRLVDRGYFRLCFHGGTVIMLVGLLSTAYCEAIWSLWLVQGLIVGTGMGMVFCSGVIAIMTWFDETTMGLATGLCAAGSCLGGIVYVTVAHHFLTHSTFKVTMLIVFGIATLTMIPANLHFRLRTLGNTHTQARSSKVTLRSFATPSYILVALGMFFAFLGVYFGFVYIILFGRQIYQLSPTTSTNLLIAMLAANLPGRFIPALISDRCIGPLNTIIPSLFMSAAVVGLWIGISDAKLANVGALFVIACFYGFVSAGIQVLYAPTVYTFCCESEQNQTLAVDKIGVKAGGIFSCIGVACLVGTPVGGALIQYRVDRGYSQPFLGAQIFAAVCLAVGGCLLLASRVSRIGWEARRA